MACVLSYNYTFFLAIYKLLIIYFSLIWILPQNKTMYNFYHEFNFNILIPLS